MINHLSNGAGFLPSTMPTSLNGKMMGWEIINVDIQGRDIMGTRGQIYPNVGCNVIQEGKHFTHVYPECE